ncbi:MAG: hypothetical protein IPN71_16695 [Fibrobacteres bacterium]|nr:hypothetical protein [Fibrobacterota bacterium]
MAVRKTRRRKHSGPHPLERTFTGIRWRDPATPPSTERSDATGRLFFQKDSAEGSSLSWIANLSVAEAGGHRVEQEVRGILKARTPSPDSVIKRFDKPAVSPMEPIENIPDKPGYAYPEEVSPTDLVQGDTARVRWEAFEPGLALRQVVQGDRILSQSFQNVQRGLQVWKKNWIPPGSARAHGGFVPGGHRIRHQPGAPTDAVDIQPRTSFTITVFPDSVFHPRSAGEVVVRNSSNHRDRWWCRRWTKAF